MSCHCTISTKYSHKQSKEQKNSLHSRFQQKNYQRRYCNLYFNLCNYKIITQMSKKGGKDKKGQANNELQALIDQQKRQILEQSFTIRQLQDRISRMSEEHHHIVTTRSQFQKKYENKINEQRIVIESHQNTIENLNKNKKSLEAIKIDLQSIIKTQQNHIQYSQQARVRQMDQYKKLVSSEMGVLQNQLKQYNHYMKERDDLFNQRNKLKNDLQNEKQDKLRELADKQRQKVQQTDKLKDEMLMKIRDMRTNLLSLKKQQLSTTTRLAVLQNHQLTSQLQYQSKQTEKLLFENESLQKKLANMQKDVQIHKEVQEELAKRSHISKGIIKKLTNKIAQLEDELKMKGQEDKNYSQLRSNKKSQHIQSEIAKNQQMISMMDKTIEQKDRKILKLQAELLGLESQNKVMKSKIKQTQKRSYQLSNILIRYYEEVLDGKIEVKVNQNEKDQFILDVRGIKKKTVKEWDLYQCKIIVTILLNQLKNHITKHNLGIPTLNRSQILLIKDEDESKLPNINLPEHSLTRKDSKKFKQIPTSLIPKLVGSNLRQWGRTVHSNSVSNISKKFK